MYADLKKWMCENLVWNYEKKWDYLDWGMLKHICEKN